MYNFDGSNDEPPKNIPIFNQYSCSYSSGLMDFEINKIREIGDSLDTTPLKVYGKYDDSRVKATSAFFNLNEDTRWIYDKMAEAIQNLNEINYQFDITCFAESFYYNTYQDGEHFNWHIDAGYRNPSPRKLSCILLLSDPSEYDGGEFDVLAGNELNYHRSKKEKGLIIAFPSHKIHRVTPITRGTRRALLMFAHGPNFR